MNTALLIIDIQKDYFPGGKNELPRAEQSAVRAKQALTLFRGKGLPVIYMQHISKAEATFFLPGSDGVRISEQIAPLLGEKVMIKYFPDSFLDTGLQEYLSEKEICRLVVCGMMSQMCVDTTVRAAKRLGYEVILLDDACAADNLTWKGASIPAEAVHQAFMAALHGTFAEVIDTDRLADIL